MKTKTQKFDLSLNTDAGVFFLKNVFDSKIDFHVIDIFDSDKKFAGRFHSGFTLFASDRFNDIEEFELQKMMVAEYIYNNIAVSEDEQISRAAAA